MRGEPRGERRPRGEHGGEDEPGTQMSMIIRRASCCVRRTSAVVRERELASSRGKDTQYGTIGT